MKRVISLVMLTVMALATVAIVPTAASAGGSEDAALALGAYAPPAPPVYGPRVSTPPVYTRRPPYRAGYGYR